MNTYIDEAVKIIKFSALNPATTAELVIFLVLAVAAASYTLMKTAKAFSYSMADFNRVVTVILTTSAMGVVVASLMKVHLAAKMGGGVGYKVALICAMIAVVLLVGGLMCKFIMKGPYVQGVISLLLSFAAAVAVLFLANALSNAIRHGGKQFDKTKERTQEVNKNI